MAAAAAPAKNGVAKVQLMSIATAGSKKDAAPRSTQAAAVVSVDNDMAPVDINTSRAPEESTTSTVAARRRRGTHGAIIAWKDGRERIVTRGDADFLSLLAAATSRTKSSPAEKNSVEGNCARDAAGAQHGGGTTNSGAAAPALAAGSSAAATALSQHPARPSVVSCVAAQPPPPSASAIGRLTDRVADDLRITMPPKKMPPFSGTPQYSAPPGTLSSRRGRPILDCFPPHLEETIVKRAWDVEDGKIVSMFMNGISLYVTDMKRLRPNNWLTDIIMNTYIFMFNKRATSAFVPPCFPRSYCFKTFFFQNLTNNGKGYD